MEALIRTKLASLNHQQQHYVNESCTRLAYERGLRAGDQAIDVGASEGAHAAAMARLVGPTGLVHAFEPDIAHYAKLSAIENCRLWPFAASDTLSLTQLNIPRVEGWASIKDIAYLFPGEALRKLMVVTVRLDDLTEIDREKIKFIKIDVEGWEAAAIRGMLSLLEHSRADLVIENVTVGIRDDLAVLGYSLVHFDGEPWRAEGFPLVNTIASHNPSAILPLGQDVARLAEESLRKIR